MEHKTQVDGFASMTELAETIGNLRYDALTEFLSELELKLMRDSDADLERHRTVLSLFLHKARYSIGNARVEIGEAWKLCEPHMRSKAV